MRIVCGFGGRFGAVCLRVVSPALSGRGFAKLSYATLHVLKQLGIALVLEPKV